jgi:ABC-type amino acid transport substrate-binding protein
MLSTQAIANLELNQPGKLCVATSGDFPPFSMINKKGELCGLEIDLMKEICARLKLEYKPVLTSWDSILIGILSNRFDLSTEAMDVTPERAQKVNFISWIQSTGVLVTSNSEINNIFEDIKGKKVGALIASTYEKEARRLGAGKIIYYQSETTALMDLINKNLDYVVSDKIHAAHFIKLSSSKLSMFDIEKLKADKGWAVNKARPNLYKTVKDELQKMYEDGTYERIVMKYIDHNPYPSK